MQPGSPNVIQMQAETPLATPAFDVQAFLDLIKAHGVRFVHYRAMRNPVGLIDKYDSRRPNADAKATINGMWYTKGGVVTALCLGNTKETKASDAGMVDASTAQFTPLSFYEDQTPEERVFLAPYDRLYLEDESVQVTRHELVEASPTGLDKPKFPPDRIIDCVDSRGVVYRQGRDFEVSPQGLIQWGDRRPGQEIDTGKGMVYAIRYVYRPHWYVVRLIHEIRVVQQEDWVTGKKTMLQIPQSALIQREFVFENESAQNESAQNESRASVEAPADGQFPAR